MNHQALLEQHLGPHLHWEKPLEPHLAWAAGEQALSYTHTVIQDSSLSQASLGSALHSSSHAAASSICSTPNAHP